MSQLQVCLSPGLLSLYDLKGKTVVVTDVLRATTTMVVANEIGVKEIIPVATRTEASRFIGQQDVLVAGERDGKKVEGFDLGNSPLLMKDHKENLFGKSLVITTTNGTKALHAALEAKTIYIGALINVEAVASQLRKENDDILVLCAGWKNRVNLEDSLFAGALCSALNDQKSVYGDAAIMCQQLFEAHQHHLFESIKKATHYQRLKDNGIEDDIRFCMNLNSSDCVPKLVGKAIV